MTIVVSQANRKRIRASMAIRWRANFRVALCSLSSVTTWEWRLADGILSQMRLDRHQNAY
jgi:hypothetical protein